MTRRATRAAAGTSSASCYSAQQSSATSPAPSDARECSSGPISPRSKRPAPSSPNGRRATDGPPAPGPTGAWAYRLPTIAEQDALAICQAAFEARVSDALHAAADPIGDDDRD
jgi:hypothetical protein